MPLTMILLMTPMILTMITDQQTKNPYIHLKNAIKISKTPPSPKIHLKASLMPPIVMTTLLMTMILLIPPILLTMMMDPQTPKYPHIHLVATTIPSMLLMMILPAPMMMPPLTIS